MSKKHRSLRLIIASLILVAITSLAFAESSGKFKISNIFSSLTSQAQETATPQTESLPEMVIGVCDTAGPVEIESSGGTITPTAYATLGAAFTAINAGTHTGTINVEVCASTTEGTTPATLNSSGAGTASYTSVTINPIADGLTISGNPVTGFGVIQLNGADNVTINGDNPNTAGINKNLTVSNTTTNTVIANSAIRIATSAAVTSADNDTIKNLILLGNVTGGNSAAITSATGSSNSSFGIFVGGNGGATATGAPTAITSVTTNTAPSGTTVNNLLIDNNTVNQAARAIVFNGAVATVSNGVTISNNLIGDQGTATPATPPYTAPATTVYTKGIWVGGTSLVTINGNTLKNILSYVATTMTAVEIVSPVTTTAITNNTVNTIANGGTTSIVKAVLITSTTGTYSIAGNNITNVQTLAGASGTDGIEVTAASTGGTIEQNKIQTVYSRSTGTFGAYGLNLTAGTGIVIKNNFISDINMDMTGGAAFSTTFSVHGIRIAGGTNHKIYNNSVYLFGTLLGTPTASILTAAFTPTVSTITGMDVRNNIFSNTLTGGTTSIAHVSMFLPSSATSSMNLTLNNNNYFSGTTAGSTGVAHAGTTYTAVPAGPTTYAGLYALADFNPADTANPLNLRTYTNTLSAALTNDNASIVTDPLFVSSTDLHLQMASLARNVGAVIGSVTNDVDGQLRPGANAFYDIGADEFDGSTPPANDILAAAFITPSSGGTVATGVAFAPQASFTNNGTATQTSVPVRYRVLDAGMGVVCNVTTTIPTISANQTLTATFPNCTIALAGTYTIKATSENPGDLNPANDEITGTITAVAPLNGNVNVGTGGAYTSLTNPGGAFDALNAAGAAGNVTINITSDLTGETGSVALNELAGGFTVNIKPSGAARSITSTATAVSVIKLNDADNVTIDGSLSGGTDRSLSITNTNAGANTTVIWVASATNGAQSNTVKNVNLTGGNDQNVTNVFNFAIIASSSASILTGGTDLDNNTYTNNFIKKVNVGIISIGGLASNMNENTVISNNLIGPAAFGSDQIGTLGMLIFNENAPQITGNELRFIGSDLTTGGAAGRDHVGISLCTGSASWAGGTAPGIVGNVTNANVSRNRIHDIVDRATFSAVGIVENCSNAAVTNNTIANNMIYGIQANGTSGDQTVGIGISNGNTDKVVYNSVNLTGDIDPGTASSSSTSSFGISVAFATPTNLTLKDNISVMDLSSNTGTLLHAAFNLQATTFAFGTGGADFNDYYPSPANTQARVAATGGTAGVFYATLGAYQTAVTPQEANTKSVDPLFVSATDLHIPMASPVVGMATPIVGVTTDFDGQTRDAMPDIGADEFVVLVPGTLQFSSATYSVNENVAGGTVTLTVNRTGGTDGAVTVDYALGGGTATGGAACGGAVDYVNTGGTVSFINGQASKTFNVTICNDAVFEGNETFDSTLSNPTGGATLGSPTVATVTIIDDEVAIPGTLQFSSATYSVGEAGPTVTITVTRTGGSDGAVTADYATVAGGTATGGAACGGAVDYVTTTGTAMFGNGVTTSQTFTIPICDDAVFEGNETVNLALSNPTGGATLGSPNTAVLTIVDNDSAASNVTVNPGNVNYATVKDAFDAINAGTHTGAVTVDINANTTETAPAVLNSSGAGSASYTSVIVRPSVDGVTVAGPTVTGRGLIELNGADNVTIDGDNPNTAGTNRNLTITNNAANTVTFTSVIRVALNTTTVNSADNDVFRNLNIVGSATGGNVQASSSTASAANTSYGIVATGNASGATTAPTALASVSTVIATGATATNMSVSNNSVTTVGRGVAVQGSATTVFPGLSIQNNTIGNATAGALDQVYNRGITAQGSADGVISGNTVYVEGFTASSGSSATIGIDVGTISANGTYTIEKNKVNRVRNSEPQTWATYGINLNAGNNQVLRNNFVSDVKNSQVAGTGAFSTTFGAFGIRVGTGTGHQVYHNSVNLFGALPGVVSTDLTAAFGIAATGQTGCDVRNNIFVNTLTGGNPTGTRNVAIFLPSGATVAMNLTLNNNDYFVGADAQNFMAQVGTTFGTGEYTLANFDPTMTTPATNFRAYSSTLSAAGTNDNASKKVDPLFVSNTDLHIQSGSPMVAMGANVGVTMDIDGDMRPAIPAIGADEIPAGAMPGVLALSSATYSVGEGAGNLVVTVNRTGGTDGAVSVAYTLSGGTATGGAACTAGVDYINTGGSASFINGQASQTFMVPICEDAIVEGNETFNVTLGMTTGGATVGSPSTAVATIVDNDVPPSNYTVAISDVRVTEGNAGTVNATFNVTLTLVVPPVSNIGGSIASVQYATANGTATAGSDYGATSGTINFNSTGTQTVTVVVNGDTLKEANEFFFVNLSNPSPNTTITDNQGVGIIVDDDRPYVSDFDRDLKADYSVFRPSTAIWYVLRSSDSMLATSSTGPSGMIAVPGDYDGDGKTDDAVWQMSSGTWFVLQSSNSAIVTTNWGITGDKPVQGDFDGDGKTDLAVYRPSTGTWWVIRSSNSSTFAVQFGISTDKPVQGDYDGDAKTDLAVYRDGTWYILQSSTSSVVIQNWGNATDKPVSGDFDGDGRNDLAIYRNGAWWIVNSLTGTSSVISFGLATDIPAPADFDGDGTTDVAVFRPSTGDWYVLRSSNQTVTGVHWGVSGDIPTPAAYIPQ